MKKQLISAAILTISVTLVGWGGSDSTEAEKTTPRAETNANTISVNSNSAVSNIPGNATASNAVPSRRDADDVRSNAVSSNSNRIDKDRDDLNKRDDDRDYDDL